MRGQIDPMVGSTIPERQEESRRAGPGTRARTGRGSREAGEQVASCEADPVLSMNERSWGVVEEDR